jgi:hypothetical protein
MHRSRVITRNSKREPMKTWMRKLLICLGLLALAPIGAAQQPNADQAPSISDEIIQQVLEPLRTGMQTQNIDLVLSLFDKQELDSYSDLEAHLRAFFQQISQLDLRYQLLQVTADKDRATATVEIEMDAQPYEATQFAVRRSVRMRLQLKLGPKGWKIAGFTPPDFFNVEYSAK